MKEDVMVATRWRDLHINTSERRWVFPGDTHSTAKWTLTVHEVYCRHAKGEGRPYMREGAERRLRDNGFGPYHRYADEVWIGCKVCGTVHREAQIRAAAAEYLEEQAMRRVKERAESLRQGQKHDAQYLRAQAIKAAQEAHYAEHFKASVDSAMAQVAERAREEWTMANPDLAALLDD